MGRQLLMGGVIEHVTNEHNLYDNNRFFYRFPDAVLAVDEDLSTPVHADGVGVNGSGPASGFGDGERATRERNGSGASGDASLLGQSVVSSASDASP